MSPSEPCMKAGQISRHAATLGYCANGSPQVASIAAQYDSHVAAMLDPVVEAVVIIAPVVALVVPLVLLPVVVLDVVAPPPEPPEPSSSPQPTAVTSRPQERRVRRKPRFMSRSLEVGKTFAARVYARTPPGVSPLPWGACRLPKRIADPGPARTR